jgi:glycosyltransferase involved in cell wall biosynthesis
MMLRLTFVTSQLISGGAERHAISLMNRLSERGHECHAVYIKPGGDMVDDIRLGGRGTVTALKAASYLDRRALADFAAHLATAAPHVIVAANPYALLYAALARRLAGSRAKLVTTYHSTILCGLKEEVMMLGYRPLFWMADCTVFVSSAQARYSMRRGVLSRRNEVIHNGVDTRHYQPGGDPSAAAAVRRRFGFADGDYVIGLTAVLRPEKNPVLLIEAVARLRAAGLPARALMIGDGDLRGAVESRARELGVSDHVAITGFQLDVRPYVAACDAMVLCSTTETFSLAALEAMAMAKPVVHSGRGGAAEMVFPGWNGYLFTAGDTEALVARLITLSDRAVSARLGRNARRVVETLFSEGAMVDRYERTLAEICGAQPRPGGLWPAGHRLNNTQV